LREPLVVAGIAPLDRGIVREPGEVGLAVRRLGHEDAIEQQLDADVGHRAPGTAGAAEAFERGVELAHEPGHHRQAMELRVGGVVQLDPGGDIGVGRVRDPGAGHRLEVGQHGAEDHARRGRGPAGDRGMTEEVHASYYHLHVLVIGLDLGTQSVKAVVCDEGLAVRGQHAIAMTTRHPAPGCAEQDPLAWEAAIAPAIAGALAAAGAAPDDIAAIAIAGQLDGCIAVDATCRPLHPALIWQDKRAVAEAALADPALVFTLAGQVADPSHMAPKIAWLRGSGIRAARFHQPVSYVVERLTGVATIDPALASSTMLLELATGRWAEPLLAAFSTDPRELPAIAPACSIAGSLTAEGARLTGLPVGTPVAVGTGDDFTTPLGAGIAAPGASIVCAIGTAEVVGALAATPVLDRVTREPMVETHAYPTGAFFVENPGWLSGGAVRWAVQLLNFAGDAELDAAAASAPPGADGITFLPALAGAMTPVWRPEVRGTLHGLAASHDRAHVARAVLEGLAFAARDVVDRLRAMALPTPRVLLLGGGSRSAIWAQIRADVLGLPHDVAATADTCPIGAAMIAAVAAGIYPDLATAAALAPAPARTFEPAASLDEPYARYLRLVDQLILSAR
jgi:xylulokinase